MYGCDCHIGCLSGSVTRLGTELSGGVIRIGKPIQGSIVSMSKGLSGYISMVSSTNKDAYLRVSTDVLWLTPDMLGENFDIYSNVTWVID